MKKYTSIILISMMLFVFTACENTKAENPIILPDSEDRTSATVILEATVIEVSDAGILVEPVEGSLELGSADRIDVSNKDGLKLQIGDIVEIEYNGEIMETYPAQLGKVYKITLAGQAETDTNWDRIPMVMVNGKLYYDTGRESTVDGRCGNMDGEIISTVDGSQIPTKDGQSNFGSGFGYQYGADDTIEIYMNEKWIVFEHRSGTGHQSMESPYTVGVIDSANYGHGTTYLYLYDENLQKTDTLECPYYAVGNYGSTPVQILDGVLYESSVGNITKYNKCAVVAMNLQTGEWKNYPFEGTGTLDDFRVTETGIFAIGNMNGSSYVNYYSFAGEEAVTIEVKNAPAIGLSVDGDDVYFVGTEFAEEREVLYHVNVKEQSQEELLDVTEELGDCSLSYTQWYDEKMYIPNGNRLSVYNPKEKQLQQIPLPGEYACQLLMDQERMYIVDCDSGNSGETDIYCFNLKEEEIEASYHFEETVMQSYVRDGILYTLEQDPLPTVRKYELSPDGTYKKLNEVVVEAKDDESHRISDMFVK